VVVWVCGCVGVAWVGTIKRGPVAVLTGVEGRRLSCASPALAPPLAPPPLPLAPTPVPRSIDEDRCCCCKDNLKLILRTFACYEYTYTYNTPESALVGKDIV
jgi:hypothetical protein